MKEPVKIIILRESLIVSIIQDCASFCVFAALLLFNHQYLAGSTWVDLAFIILLVIVLGTKNSNRVFTGNKRDAIKWLNEDEL